MAKITELPQASTVTGEDIAVIVQDGVTKQVPRSVLAPDSPDDLLLTDRLLQLGVGGEAVGTGVKLPQEQLALWNDITLDEDVASISITQTDAGVPINIKKLFLFFHGSFTAANPRVSVFLKSGVFYQMVHQFTVEAGVQRAFWLYSEELAPGLFHSLYSKTLFSGVTSDKMDLQGLIGANVDVRGDLACMALEAENYHTAQNAIISAGGGVSFSAGSRILVFGVQDTDS